MYNKAAYLLQRHLELLCLFIYIYTYISLYIFISLYIYIYLSISIHIYLSIYIYTHIYNRFMANLLQRHLELLCLQDAELRIRI